MTDLLASLEELERQIDALLLERQSIISILDTFVRSPLSASTLQPVLDLAVRLNALPPT